MAMTNERVVAVELQSWTMGGTSKRGILSVVLESGERLAVDSPSEDGEVPGSGNYNHQKDAGVRMAVSRGVQFAEINLDLIDKVLEAKKKPNS